MLETVLTSSIISEPHIIALFDENKPRGLACDIDDKADAITTHSMLHEDYWFCSFLGVNLAIEDPH
jgi:hypothetical protein